MNNNLVEIVFILDRSGSMAGLAGDTIGGFNGFIDTQKQIADGEAKLTTVLFDNEYEILHNGVNIKDVELLTEKEYYARGSTALLDAIGKTINEVGARLANTAETERPGKVLFVITTDGMENASAEFNTEQIKEMVEHQKNIYKWEFIFLGANIDSISTAASYGINIQNAKNYTADAVGTQSIYTTVSAGISNMRGNLSVSESDDVNFDSNILTDIK